MEYYNITDPLIIKKIDYDSSLDLSSLNDTNRSDSIKFEFYNPYTKEKLDTTVIEDVSFSISTKIKDPDIIKIPDGLLNGNNVSEAIDPFDPEHKAFSSRCFISENMTSGTDTTINTRRSQYFSGTASCSEDCTYDGLDEYDYVKCNCTKFDTTKEMSSTIGDDVLSVLPSLNIDIVACTFKVFGEVINYKMNYLLSSRHENNILLIFI